MPTYMCPKCSRTVTMPEGNYTCKICGVQMRPVEAEAISLPKTKRKFTLYDREKFETFINDAIEDEEKAEREYRFFADYLKETFFQLEPADGRIYFYVKEAIEKLREIASDEERHERMLRIILREVYLLAS